MQLINTKIIPGEWDGLWNESALLEHMDQVKVLVLTSPLEKNSPEEQTLLKMLQACTLQNSDYKIISINASEKLAWYKIREQVQPKVVILAGILPIQLGIAAMFRLNEPNLYNDCTWIPTLDLAELEKLPEMKKQLWNMGLKPVFQL